MLSRLFAAFRPKALTEFEIEDVRDFVNGVRLGNITDELDLDTAWRRKTARLALRRGYVRDGGFWSASPGYTVTRKGERFLEGK